MAGQNIERREILRMMAVAAAAAPFTGFSKWSFACGHAAAATAQVRPATYTPQFFTPPEYALLSRLTELIIPSDETPGAKEAGVAEFIDFLIAHDPSNQYNFRKGLGWMNAHSGLKYGKPFLEITEPQQVDLLVPLAYSKKFREGEDEGRTFFNVLKEHTLMGFYTSEIGFKELDNPALKFYTKSPECPHHADDPEHKHLPPAKWPPIAPPQGAE